MVHSGALRLDFVVRFAFTNDVKTVRVKWGADTILQFTTGAAGDIGPAHIQVLIANSASASVQRTAASIVTSAGAAYAEGGLHAEDSTSDVDIVVTAQLANGSDRIGLEFSLAEFIGTD